MERDRDRKRKERERDRDSQKEIRLPSQMELNGRAQFNTTIVKYQKKLQ
jgi:hypothetical protein